MICWGISWPASKVLTNYSDPYTLMFLKFFISSFALFPMLFIIKDKIVITKQLLKQLTIATIFIILYNLFLFYGLSVGFAGLGGIVVTGSNPIFTFLLVALIDKINIPPLKKIALVLGVAGIALTLNITNFKFSEIVDGGNIFFLLSSLAWSFLTIVSNRAKNTLNSFYFSIILYFISSFVSYILFVENDKLFEIFTFDIVFWANLFFVTVITTGVATTIYFQASNILGASYASSFIFLVPVVAVLSSSLFLNEAPQSSSLVGGAILILSVWLINKR